MANGDVTTGEIMEFLKEHMVTKEELHQELSRTKEELHQEILGVKEELRQELFGTKEELRQELSHFATKEELVQFKDEILSAVDGLVVQYKNFDVELAALRSTTGRHEDRLEVVEKKLGLSAA